MKYAPPDNEGRKPYVRKSQEFTRAYETIVYVWDADEARHAYRRALHEDISVRRATPADIEAFHVDGNYEPNR